MAQFNKGILGGFSGKVGTVVGAKWRDKYVMRSLPSKSSKKPTEAQLKQRGKFSLMVKFLSPLRKITSKFFGEYQGSKSRTDLAMSYQMTDTIIELPNGDLEIDFKKVVLSKGYVPTVAVENISLLESVVTINWTDNTNKGDAKENDIVHVVIYSKEHNEFVVSPDASILRKNKKVEIAVPSYFKAKDNVAWLLLSNNLRSQGSNSVYVGEV